MCKVFIDTNIFLRLYQTNQENLNNIFEDISKLKDSLVFVNQVSDEFLRNRDKIFSELINNVIKNKIPKPHVTSIIKSLDEFSELKKAGDELNQKHQKLIEKLKKIKDDLDTDIVYTKFYELYNDSALTVYERTDDIIDKAHKRMLIGNPPIDDKKNTIGDQIIWETLISNLKDDLIFITYDDTYKNHISFLKNEYKKRVDKELSITDKVSSALTKIKVKPSKELIYFEKYAKTPIVSAFVNLRNFKGWFLDILDIDIYYEDGKELQIQPHEEVQFSTALEDTEFTKKGDEMYDTLKEYETTFKNTISSILNREGYGEVDINAIDYDIVEYIPPED
ncbi:MAG: hypothetical protein MPEBLZ_03034 [Candidatus Methanoperedens nitroreducens]|uniref:DUF4935 domain-containing protein n=1 Tax=Candidatus Methanoperedens nitratireducens TaxID=1392998 RepID=A0A0P8CI08_9EURY|nr:PIN domain-containing protein [Candidatus Methanoperedens sp. BLZ2]KAB2944581.1 MAG: hypothetical protein F9K14_13910 [Candidatus Methanoperedens sp.]KPQ42405.1 MAG: hypothetical protein MPEBLZ_03034 [Candidatus Methanoperedens sp. BLZ1]MBZ0176847.1 PIN domain-containing protein [Candidatus Methanoperedens nitroreducens]CAG0999645.1 hypothetical protein METP2_03164 [Methanosarcinales archaeon]MCX9077080.1 PIN domain-containing protein [Candidatus Methanoperedens sp.]